MRAAASARLLIRATKWLQGEALQKNCRWSSGEPELMEDAAHCTLDGLIVGVDRFGVV
jgi:hypothetical protein